MLDINFIRNNPDKVKQAIANKHENAATLTRFWKLIHSAGLYFMPANN